MQNRQPVGESCQKTDVHPIVVSKPQAHGPLGFDMMNITMKEASPAFWIFLMTTSPLFATPRYFT